MNESEVFNKKVEAISKLVEEIHHSLDKINVMLEGLNKEVKRDIYRNVEGIIGTYDGSHLVDPQGNKYEVPANYAAKSRLVFGDTIKMVEDEGKTVFKQIQKVERKTTEGVLSKKEGKWYILTDSGSYRISDIAADFNQAQLNDEAVCFLPAQNLNAPFATLDKIHKKEIPQNTQPVQPNKNVVKPFKQPVATKTQPQTTVVTPVKKVEVVAVKKPVTPVVKEKEIVEKKPVVVTQEVKESIPEKKVSVEPVKSSAMDDDDLR